MASYWYVCSDLNTILANLAMCFQFCINYVIMIAVSLVAPSTNSTSATNQSTTPSVGPTDPSKQDII